MASYKDLIAQKEKLEKQIEEVKNKERAAIVAEVRQKVQEFDLSPRELGLSGRKARKPAAKAAVAPKYMNPNTGETWSGRGRAPAWIGKNRDKFLIK